MTSYVDISERALGVRHSCRLHKKICFDLKAKLIGECILRRRLRKLLKLFTAQQQRFDPVIQVKRWKLASEQEHFACKDLRLACFLKSTLNTEIWQGGKMEHCHNFCGQPGVANCWKLSKCNNPKGLRNAVNSLLM